MIKIGVIGCGAISERKHLPLFAECSQGEVVAVADVREEKAKDIAAKFGVKDYYSRWEEMMKRDDIEAVSIATPNFLHREMAVAAAEAGKHVLVEKPIATSLEEAEEMIKAAKENSVILMVQQTQRFSPRTQKVKELIEEGIIGKINTIRGKIGNPGPENWSPTGKWFFNKKQSFGGALADVGIHIIDLIRWIMGKEVKEVSAFLGTLEKKIEVEDNGICLFRFEGGPLGIAEASWTTKPGMAQMSFYGEKGSLTANLWGENPLTVNLSSMEKITPEIPAEGKYGTPFQYFLDCIEKGDEPFISGEEAKKSLEIILAAYESSAARKVIDLPLKK